MVNGQDYKVIPDWELEVLHKTGPRRHGAVSEVTKVGENAYFAVQGRLPLAESWPILYVLRKDMPDPQKSSGIIRIAAMALTKDLAPMEPIAPEQPPEVRLPQKEAFLFTATACTIHIVAAKHVFSHDELAKLTEGREPPPTTTVRDTT